ncbi:MAG TPA: response regulator [Geobacteraceae bacterium]
MGTKLLLADDSITIQKVVGIIFAGDDYELAIVDNGDAALAKAREIRPDVFLVDAVMPGRTGYEVCEEVRRDPLLKGVPILLLTGAFEPFDEVKARQSGADDFIAKPFESQHLIDKVTHLAELSRQRKSAPPAPEPVAAPSFQPPPPVIERPAAFVPPQPPPAARPAPAAAAEFAETAPDGAAQFAVEVVEGTPDDDLWGAFELDEVAENDAAGFGEVSFAGEEEPFVTEVIEEPFSFAEEPETAAQPSGLAPRWEPVAEDAFAFEEEGGGAAFETAAGEEPAALGEEGGAFEVVPEEEFGIFEEEPTPVFETAAQETADFFAEMAEPAVAAEGQVAMVPPPAGADFGLQFAPEEEYVPVSDAASAAAPSPAAAGEISLSEEQLAALVSRISRDILEKIAWEVVPDLAERIIREEIRMIKEGR